MNRRNFVKTGVAATVGVSSLSMAGCSQIPLLGSGGSYENWLHEPGEITSTEHYPVLIVKPKKVINNEDVFDGDRVSAIEDQYDGQLDPTGVDTDETNQIIRTNATTIFTGGFNVSDVTAELEDNDFDDETEMNGFTIYTTDNEQRAWAVGSNALVQTGMRDDPAADVAETVIDVKNGNEDRYVDENDGMNVLTNKLDNGFGIYTTTREETSEDDPERGVFENSVGTGLSETLSGDTVDVKYVVAYEESDDVDTGDLEDWVDEQQSGTFDDVDDVSYNKSGRAGVIKGTMDADDVTFFG